MIDKLKVTYEKQGLASRVDLQKKWRSLSMVVRSNMEEYFVTFEGTLTELKQAVGKFPEDEAMFKSIVTSIDILFSKDSSLITVKCKLLAEERRIKQAKSNVSDQLSHTFPVFKGRAFQKYQGGKKFYDSSKKTQAPEFYGKSYNCSGREHKRYQCPSTRLFSEHQVSTPQDPDEHCDIAFLVNVNKNEECFYVSSDFVRVISFGVDSGSTNHLGKSEPFHYVSDQIEVENKISVAKARESFNSTCKGELHLQIQEGINITHLIITLSDQLSLNSLSVKKMEEG
ncbi:hypothetical protein PR048_011935 [Dryococelus australis]|uniref:Uncharacterized protein n=1 Tax=Dryococelus australis TaxID=614101 RepID=A0ABQ9HMW9_9NEOP|nr:hypothetical protein PR048_011935 [Dryococelus australis]